MKGFAAFTPTRILFGAGSLSQLSGKDIPARKVLLVTGVGGSLRRNGTLAKVEAMLAREGVEFVAFPSVEPNPSDETVMKGAEAARENGCGALLAVGGGSVIDCAKAICAARYYEGDAWDIVTDPSKITKALPLVTVLTLAATGSEYDAAAVISNMDENKKIGVLTPVFYPRVSICDPEYTFSVSKKQTAAGCADIMSHIFEQYCVKDSNLVSDGLCETVLRAVLGMGKRAYDKGDDYEARATLMWASSLACNGICVTGNSFAAWVCHGIEHELSGWNGEVTHGAGLAVIIPSWMAFVAKTRPARVEDFALRVMRVEKGATQEETVARGIEALKAFYRTLGMPVTLAELKVPEAPIEKLAKGAVRKGLLGKYVPLDEAAVKTILENAR